MEILGNGVDIIRPTYILILVVNELIGLADIVLNADRFLHIEIEFPSHGILGGIEGFAFIDHALWQNETREVLLTVDGLLGYVVVIAEYLAAVSEQQARVRRLWWGCLC